MTHSPLTSLQVMQDAPVIPVIVLNDVAHAVPMARALVQGGIRMLEVTLRTPQALACIEAIAKAVPEAVVGAGTLRSKADARSAPATPARWAQPVATWACPCSPEWPLAAKSWRRRKMALRH